MEISGEISLIENQQLDQINERSEATQLIQDNKLVQVGDQNFQLLKDFENINADLERKLIILEEKNKELEKQTKKMAFEAKERVLLVRERINVCIFFYIWLCIERDREFEKNESKS